MRISDWSSDVCSSDLETAKIGERDQLLAVRRQARRRPFGSPRGGAHAIEAQMRPAIEALLAGATIDGVARDDMIAGLQVPYILPDLLDDARRLMPPHGRNGEMEIGRESWRARECEYV